MRHLFPQSHTQKSLCAVHLALPNVDINTYRVTFKEWPPYSAGKCAFFEVYHTLWDIITPNKPILVKNEL